MQMSMERFEELVSEGIESIDQKFLKKLDNVAIVVEERPSAQQTRKQGLRKNELLLGLYEGLPKTARGTYSSALPDKITIFRDPILRSAKNIEDIPQIVADTVWHEIAHHFGMDERQVRTAERRSGRSGWAKRSNKNV